MKTDLKATARAFLDLAETCDPTACGALCDAANKYLSSCGCPPDDFTAFVRAVRSEALKRTSRRIVRLTTPSGFSGLEGERIHAAIERSVERKLTLAEDADSRLIGGAILALGDDRADASLRGALQRLQSHLAST